MTEQFECLAANHRGTIKMSRQHSVRGTTRSPQAAEWRAVLVETVLKDMHKSWR